MVGQLSVRNDQFACTLCCEYQFWKISDVYVKLCTQTRSERKASIDPPYTCLPERLDQRKRHRQTRLQLNEEQTSIPVGEDTLYYGLVVLVAGTCCQHSLAHSDMGVVTLGHHGRGRCHTEHGAHIQYTRVQV